ncbi:MAG: phenylalanine--tRNA ligase subunit beta [Actinobacteria bacterium HGW-Actinobacteria-4]|nr:MAG: phenylalanine--tRNA ligase subunit beta [Actinobacteria bacterium HGW-Actinobacteria-4]
MPKLPMTWLAESVALGSATPEDVAAALVRVGLEEEGIHRSGVEGPLVVGRVLSVVPEKQSNGKTINYCRVDVGEHNDPAGPGHAPDDGIEYPTSRGIVCGAHNFAAGDFVVVVLPGATLPGPFPISGRKTYGHWSDGMICSSKELALGDDHDGIMVLHSAGGGEDLGYDPAALTPGQDAIELLGLGEQTVEITVTPDRGYCFSIRGAAREYSHATGQPFTDPAGLTLTGKTGNGFAVELADGAPIRGNDGCDRFVARILRGFDPTRPSPAFMQRRLTQSGMRPISLAVDVTNYVMLELGHPLHAYDLAKVTAPIVVRRAWAGETLITLDDQKRKLDPEDIVVTDSVGGHGKRAIGMGGVMGGLDTEVSETTTDILLEAAHWDPITIARTARRHKLGSEASRRYERGVDTALAPAAIERALSLMVEYGGGTIEDVYTDVNNVAAREPIVMSADFPARIVGIEFGEGEVVESLRAIGCEVSVTTELKVTPPTWRPDLREPIDLVEEVGRLHGYDQLPSVLPVAPPGRGLTHPQKVRRSVARALAESGLTEVLTYPFIAPARLDELGIPADDPRRLTVALANPIAADQPLMRTSLIETLVDAVKVNVGRGAQDVAIFEVGRAYKADGSGAAPRPDAFKPPTEVELKELDAALPAQPRRAAGIMAGHRVLPGWNAKGEPFEWTDAVAAALTVARVAGVEVEASAEPHMPWHPGRCATYRLADGTFVGHAGELHPKVCETLGLPKRAVAFEMVLDPLIAASEDRIVVATPVAAQPLAKEDFAFVVDASVTAASLVAVVRKAGGDLVEDVRVFDVYAGEQVGAGKKSLAVNVRMRAEDHTLEPDEVLGVRNAIVAAAAQELGAQLR